MTRQNVQIAASARTAGVAEVRVGCSETNRKAHCCELTSAGHRHVDEEARNWKRVSVAIDLALAK